MGVNAFEGLAESLEVLASAGEPGRGLARRDSQATAIANQARLGSDSQRAVASSAVISKIVRVNLLRRHPIALALLALLVVSALQPLPALVDAVTGAPPADADLVRPTAYTVFAPLSNLLDALTFLSLERAQAFLIAWAVALAAWGALRRGSLRQRIGRAAVGPLALLVASGTLQTLQIRSKV